MGHRFVVIVNPAAGGGRCGRQAPAAIEALRTEGLELEVLETAAPGDATRLARAAWHGGARHFVCVGGDGTGFEIVNGLFPEALEAAVPPTLGFLPLGTGNSFLRDFATDGGESARQALLEGRRRACDVVRLRHREGDLYYINILSFGWVADVCALTNRRFKGFGAAGYGLGVVSKVVTLKCRPIPMRVDDGDLEDEPRAFIAISNTRFTGGTMMMAPAADSSDGLVDLITVGRLGRVGLLRTFPKIFNGSHLANPAVAARQVRGIEFALEGPADAMIDGEVIRLWPERVEVVPGALQVHV